MNQQDCFRCGHPLQFLDGVDEIVFCPSCGERLNRSVSTSKALSSPPARGIRTKRWLIVGACGLGLGIFAVVLGVFGFRGNRPAAAWFFLFGFFSIMFGSVSLAVSMIAAIHLLGNRLLSKRTRAIIYRVVIGIIGLAFASAAIYFILIKNIGGAISTGSTALVCFYFGVVLGKNPIVRRWPF